jgi:hypothetical protein
MSPLEWALLALSLGLLAGVSYYTRGRRARSPEEESSINAAEEAARHADKWAH